ncbi:hypothetical protein GQ55_3G476000 [Panicum hallii var. hallii]|uniref:Uncharacterized protein n=1 Tax=Panicum hallii var. hallii TaxID=1504633 RepID=A0A2T7EJE8_9POAL|nr:hypothetical protein GQ55_3G476000 [Panicum hallii var. hallii]
MISKGARRTHVDDDAETQYCDRPILPTYLANGYFFLARRCRRPVADLLLFLLHRHGHHLLLLFLFFSFSFFFFSTGMAATSSSSSSSSLRGSSTSAYPLVRYWWRMSASRPMTLFQAAAAALAIKARWPGVPSLSRTSSEKTGKGRRAAA